MKRIFAFFACAVFLCSCASSEICGSGPEVTRTFGLPADFSSFDISGAISVTCSPDADGMTVTADSVSMADFVFSVKDGVLSLGRKQAIFTSGRKNGGMVSVVISAPSSVSCVRVSGASSFIAEQQIEGDEFRLRLSGASRFKGDVCVRTLYVDVSGASAALISGTASDASYSVSGASEVSSSGSLVMSDVAEVGISGASNVVLGCSSSLSGDVSGASRLSCYGDCLGNVNVTGASAFKRY